MVRKPLMRRSAYYGVRSINPALRSIRFEWGAGDVMIEHRFYRDNNYIFQQAGLFQWEWWKQLDNVPTWVKSLKTSTEVEADTIKICINKIRN